MLDTVRVHVFGQWQEAPSPGWTQMRFESQAFGTSSESLPKRGKMLKHDESGLRVGGNDERAEWMEVSLPRLLHGDNGKMIKTQAELDQVVSRVDELVREVCRPGDGKIWSCSRVDLVGQFAINPRDVITAHREATHPAIRKEKIHYEGESLAFRGKERTCRMYDKIKEATNKPGDITRVEWQLRGEALRRDFSRDTINLKNLVLEDCYDVYRKLCVALTPRGLPTISDLNDLLALAVADNACIGGTPVFDLWARGKHRKTVQRVRREIARRRPAIHFLDWNRLTPPEFGQFPLLDTTGPS